MLRSIKNRWALALLSAFLFFLGIRGFWGGITIWVAFWPWFYLLDRIDRPLRAFFYSALVGFLFYLQSALWLTHVTVIGYLLLCIVLAVYFGIFGWTYKKVAGSQKSFGVFFLAALWVSLEYLRGIGPFAFPWFLLGASQFEHLELIQIVAIGNIYLLSFMIILFNLASYRWFFYKESRRKIGGWLSLAFSLLLIAGSVAYGYVRLLGRVVPSENVLKIALIQANIPQEEKWDSAQAKFNLEKHVKLSRVAATYHPDLIVWPETALPSELKSDKYVRSRVKTLAQKSDAYLLLGGNDWSDQEKTVTNSAFLMDPKGRLIDQYDKVHLVPYGEYVPFRKWMGWVGKITIGEIDFTAGTVFRVFRIKSHAFSAVICFEDILASHVRKFMAQGARLMLNLTNDAWFGQSSAAVEHLKLAAFAALVNGVGLARATNTGVSAFISPYGEILDKVHDERGEFIEVEGVIVRKMSMDSVPTFYQKYGDVFAIACGCVCVFLGMFYLIKEKFL